MNRDGVRQAAQVLRTHVTSLGAHDHLAQVSTVASLVYADRLNQPPIYPGDPNTVEEVSTRFSEILGDHLDLAAIILSAAGGMLDINPVRLLDEIVVTRLGSYSWRWHRKAESQVQVSAQIAMVITVTISLYFSNNLKRKMRVCSRE
jgi:hypothetical protein